MTVKEARQAMHLTQKALSEWLGIPRRTIEDWDSGKSNPPKWVEGLLIEKIFNYRKDNKMRIFEVVVSKEHDEYTAYIGVNYEDAVAAYNKELELYNSYLTDSERERTSIEPRVYSIEDTIDINDEDELNNALIECIGYDFFADEI